MMLLQAALMRVCGVVSSSTLQIQTEEIGHIHHRHCSQQQRQLQQVRQHLLVFIAPADTCGRRQGILLPKKLLQLFVLRRLGWEVRQFEHFSESRTCLSRCAATHYKW